MGASGSKSPPAEEGSGAPRRSNSPLYELLREGKVGEFNRRIELGERVDLRGCDFRGIDLRGLDPTGIDFSGCYFRQADLRGIDFRKATLEGASINGARISGAYFPESLVPEEIRLSLNYGTRMRYVSKPEPVVVQVPMGPGPQGVSPAAATGTVAPSNATAPPPSRSRPSNPAAEVHLRRGDQITRGAPEPRGSMPPVRNSPPPVRGRKD